MHIAYGLLTENKGTDLSNTTESNTPSADVQLRYQAYLKTCEKFGAEIVAIQKYFPGWVPPFQRS